ncbi:MULTISPECIES: lipoyl synthase [Desulfosediminicola]|uniref:lipoyl synthase n=1 Tax=Desulfosediminicola TaxID=2886823 RepID=UPI0010AD985A|nr:lipoyl synthase [Desulfosediminicola ganghwensis]
MAGCNNKGGITRGKPRWLRRSLPTGPEYEKMRNLLKNNHLHTVCQEAQCPNQYECYSEGTATFMILGERCTRNCHFCAVEHKPLTLPDPDEPGRVAEAVDILQLRYAVITSVTRDDLEDGGATLFAETISAVRIRREKTLIEVLIPDLQGNWQALKTITDSRPDVLNHNMETVSELYPRVRPEAIYQRSLELIAEVKRQDPRMVTKSGIMVGLGETPDQLMKTFDDLLEAGCDILTLGQYLQPSKNHLPVERFVEPEEFDRLGERALERGFSGVAAGPFVRSSYQAEKLYRKVRRRFKAC